MFIATHFFCPFEDFSLRIPVVLTGEISPVGAEPFLKYHMTRCEDSNCRKYFAFEGELILIQKK